MRAWPRSCPYVGTGFGWRTLAAAAVILGVLGIAAVSQQPWRDQPGVSQAGVADRVMAAEDSKHVKVSFPDGATATVIRSAKLGKAVVVTEKMPAAPSGKVYELWLRNSVGRMVPAGLMTRFRGPEAAPAGQRRDSQRRGDLPRAVRWFEGAHHRADRALRLRPGRRMTHPDHVAVVGSGVAGLLAAHVLARRSTVTLYEADARLGGHADTHLVEHAGEELAIDTGFIVHNLRTYPHLLRLFDELGVATQDSEMSMSVRADDRIDAFGGLEYAGALGGSGLFPTWRNALRPSYLRMLTELPRFHRMAKRLVSTSLDRRVAAGSLDRRTTTRPSVSSSRRGHFSPLFRTHFMESLVACVWSCDPAVALEYPARYLFRFLEHHGMLGVLGSPQWRTVTGGSREYVARVAARLVASGSEVRTGTKVTSVLETPEGVEITDGNGRVDRYDAVVVATHPHQALAMLADPTPAQAEVLAAMPYSRNTAQLHTDTSILPRLPRARASWNYLRRSDGREGVTVTYDMTRLQRLPVPADGTRFLVTLGGQDLVDQSKVIDTMEYEHPLYTPESVAAQGRLAECDTEPGGLRGRLARLGLPRGRRPLGCRGRASAGGGVVAPGPGHARTCRRRSSRRPTRARSATPAVRRSSAPSPTTSTPGWSTSTTCLATASSATSRAASRHATTSASRTAPSRPTSSGSWRSTAWRATGAAS